MPFVMPNTDEALILFLRNHALLTPAHAGRVGTKLTSSLTSIRVASVGGSRPWAWEAHPEYQLEFWGGTQEQAKDLSAKASAVVYELPLHATYGAFIRGASVTLEPFHSPDPNGRERYIGQVQLDAYTEAT